jgi:hypothetical protein
MFLGHDRRGHFRGVPRRLIAVPTQGSRLAASSHSVSVCRRPDVLHNRSSRLASRRVRRGGPQKKMVHVAVNVDQWIIPPVGSSFAPYPHQPTPSIRRVVYLGDPVESWRNVMSTSPNLTVSSVGAHYPHACTAAAGTAVLPAFTGGWPESPPAGT